MNLMLPIQQTALLLLGKRRRTSQIRRKRAWYKTHVACTEKRKIEELKSFSEKDFSMKTTALRAQYFTLLSALMAEHFGSDEPNE
jgi:hypothetical protein